MNAPSRTTSLLGPRGSIGRRLTVALVVGTLSVTLLLPTSSLAAPREPQPAPPAGEPSRAPTYAGQAGPTALQLPGEPPELGEPILVDALDAPGAFVDSIRCPSRRNVGDFVGEGYILKVTGRCAEGAPALIVTPAVPQLTVPDGEIQVEAKVVSGHDRALVLVVFRTRADPPHGYTLFVTPLGGVLLNQEFQQTPTPLASRTDLADRMSRDDWNTIAVRLDGPDIWVFVNGEPVLSASDSLVDSGSVHVGLLRTGNVDDNAESAVVFRNLRVSALASRP